MISVIIASRNIVVQNKGCVATSCNIHVKAVEVNSDGETDFFCQQICQGMKLNKDMSKIMRLITAVAVCKLPAGASYHVQNSSWLTVEVAMVTSLFACVRTWSSPETVHPEFFMESAALEHITKANNSATEIERTIFLILWAVQLVDHTVMSHRSCCWWRHPLQWFQNNLCGLSFAFLALFSSLSSATVWPSLRTKHALRSDS